MISVLEYHSVVFGSLEMTFLVGICGFTITPITLSMLVVGVSLFASTNIKANTNTGSVQRISS